MTFVDERGGKVLMSPEKLIVVQKMRDGGENRNGWVEHELDNIVVSFPSDLVMTDVILERNLDDIVVSSLSGLVMDDVTLERNVENIAVSSLPDLVMADVTLDTLPVFIEMQSLEHCRIAMRRCR